MTVRRLGYMASESELRLCGTQFPSRRESLRQPVSRRQASRWSNGSFHLENRFVNDSVQKQARSVTGFASARTGILGWQGQPKIRGPADQRLTILLAVGVVRADPRQTTVTLGRESTVLLVIEIEGRRLDSEGALEQFGA
jgi:hypothetical protein